MKQLPLANTGLYTLIDDEDYEVLSKHKWNITDKGYVYRVVHEPRNDWNKKSAKGRYIKHTIRMHRFLLQPKPSEWCDHINGNRLDNRRANLRICSPAQNSWNRGISKKNTTGAKGIDFLKNRNAWRARIYVEGKCIYLGYTHDKEEAINLYKQAIKKYYKEYARIL